MDTLASHLLLIQSQQVSVVEHMRYFWQVHGMQLKKFSTSQKLSELGKYALALLLLTSSLQAISAEKPQCRWGDCEDGLGEKTYPSSTGGKPWSYIANFRDGKRYKYAIRMREGSNWICEVPYTTRGNRSGLQVCATERGSIEFAYVDPKGKVKGSPYLRLFKG